MKKKKRLLIIEVIILLVLVGTMYFIMKDKKSSDALEEEVAIENEERIEKMEEIGHPMIVVSNAKIKKGDKVTVGIKVVNNPGILGMSATLSYDENVLKLIDVEEGTALKDVLTMSHSKDLSSGCSFLWDGEAIAEEQIKDGDILNLEFKVLKSASAGKSPVMFVLDENGIYDNELKLINLNVENGYVTVVE